MIKPFTFVILRAPLQSLEKVYQFNGLNNAAFEEGIYLASKEFWKEYQKIETLSLKEREKLELSFRKYWIRSCMRCTPFATFAGTMIVNVQDNDTVLTIKDDSAHLRKVRVDMNYMTAIANALAEEPVIRQQIKFTPNNSLYELPGTYRYAEYKIVNNERGYQLTAVQKDSYIEAVLLRAQSGATISQLAEVIMNKVGVNEAEACQFIIDMWQSQLLVSSLELNVTGTEPVCQLLEQLHPINGAEEIVERLKRINQLLEVQGRSVPHYLQIEKELTGLGAVTSVPKDTLQTDLFLSSESNVIDRRLIEAIVEQVSDLQLLSRKNDNKELEDFKSAFYKKYETAEIPLAIALDADMGIGYAGVYDGATGDNQLINDLLVSGPQEQKRMIYADYIRQYVFDKYMQAKQDNRSFIEIEERELKRFGPYVEPYTFPGSMYIIGNLFCEEGVKLRSDKFSFRLSGFGGPSAGNLLGRFTQGSDHLLDLTRQLLQEEEKEEPDVIYAEIVHLPQARIGNILLRPALRRYEIPYVGKSGADIANQISIDDLLVSIVNNKVVLRSKRLNKKVIPRLTTAHNFHYKSLPVYKFLCDLQMQDLAHPNVWDWGEFSNEKHLPRVVYKNIIVKRARWRIEESDIEKIPSDQSGLIDWSKKFLTKWKLPSRIVYIEGDNELLIDFAYIEGVNLFLQYIKKYKRIHVEEWLFTPENCIVKNTSGQLFCSEIIIPVSREVVSKKEEWGLSSSHHAQRKFFPGSEWNYFKIYTGPQSGEKLLTETILPFILSGIKDSLFQRFFFIRYKDDFSHLRVRFWSKDCTNNARLQQNLMNVLQPKINAGIVDKVVMDTYSRELERYDAEIIEEVESMFFNDSLCVLQLLSLLEEVEEKEKYRLLFALRGVDMLMNDFGISLMSKYELLKGIYAGFYREFGGHRTLQKQLNDKYRVWQKDIVSHMNIENDRQNGVEEAITILEKRSLANEEILQLILEKDEQNERQRISKFVPSLIHMFLNRLFLSQQRKYELVVYHFLERYYRSAIAIKKV